MANILIAEDRRGMREMVVKVLSAKGHSVAEAEDGQEALDKALSGSFDLIVTDLRLPKLDGMEILKQLRKQKPRIPIIMITAYGTLEIAVEAMKRGASDFIAKPFPIKDLEDKVEVALAGAAGPAEQKSADGPQAGFIIGPSEKMQKVQEIIAKVSRTEASVLIRGETGTGKELVAKAIHESSPRRDRPFIRVSCAALAEGVLESELFGHEKGAFTSAHERKQGRFELANKGTLFLDEIGDISTGTQMKLLRVLQEKEFERVGGTQTIKTDVRIITATNRNLEEAIKQEKFREDLFYRLNVVPVYLPTLRERREDIPSLVQHFLEKYSPQAGSRTAEIRPEVIETLMAYSWPGNVRELENVIARAVVMGTEGELDTEVLTPGVKAAHEAPISWDGKNLAEVLENVEKKLIEDALKKSDWNHTRAAELLGVNRSSLYYKMLKYDLVKK